MNVKTMNRFRLFNWCSKETLCIYRARLELNSYAAQTNDQTCNCQQYLSMFDKPVATELGP